MINNIQKMYKIVHKKNDFIKVVAEDLKKSPNTLTANWFQQNWAIPKKHQARVVQLLQHYLRQQIKKTQEVLEL